MSADLDSRPTLPKIRVGVLETPQACSGGATIPDRHPVEKEADECRTPKSAEFKIPAILICPPAPRKPKRPISSSSCKRKLAPEFHFFDLVNREEVESFFRSGFAKRRKTCPDLIPS